MLYPFILTTLAGLATMLGTIPIFVKIKNKDNIISAACSFASAVMICISIFDLIPEGISSFRNNFNGLWIVLFTFIFIIIGVIVSMIMDHYVDKASQSSNLFKVGIMSMIAIILHNIPEGIVTFIVSDRNIILGISICIAIALHNIPEGISIAIPINYSTGSKKKALLYTFISSLSEPIGAIIAWLFLSKYMNDMILGMIFSFIAGVMMQIAFSKLLPTGNSYNKKLSLIFFVIGFVVMGISLLLNSLIS